MWDIRAGMKVICVNDDIHAFNKGFSHLFNEDLSGLKAGEIYTIRECSKHPKAHPFAGEPGVRLKEIIRPFIDGDECRYNPRRFRPLNKNFSMLEESLRQPLKTKTKIRKVEQA